MSRRGGNWWARLRRRLSDQVRQRVTRLGFAYTGITILIGAAAFVSANNLLFLILAALLSTLLISGFVSRLGLAGLKVDLLLPEHLAARVPATARIRLENRKSLLPSFSLRLEGTSASAFTEAIFFPAIPARSVLEEPVTVCFPRRGQFREDSLRFSTRFPFGFTERRVDVEIERDVIVYPSILPRPGFEEILSALEGQIVSRRQGRGEDFHRIRPYELNESARRVDWKTTARTGRLQVREYVRPEQPMVEILLDLAAPGEALSWFEEAVECCAFLAWSLSEQNVQFQFKTQKCNLVCPEETDVYAILRFLALVEARGHLPALDTDSNDSVAVVFSVRDPRAVSLASAGAGADPDHGGRKRPGGVPGVADGAGREGAPPNAGRQSR
jgi:uncharacterized protein (DUF58 family)